MGAGAGDLTLGRPNDVPSGTTQAIDTPIMQNRYDTFNPHVTRQAQSGKNLTATQVLADVSAEGRSSTPAYRAENASATTVWELVPPPV